MENSETCSNNIEAKQPATHKNRRELKDFSNLEIGSLVVFGFISLNVGGWLLAEALKLDRPVFNLDFLIPFVVYLWISRSFSAVILVTVIFLDILKVVIPAFFITTEAFSVLFWIKTVRHWPLTAVLPGLAMVVAITGVAIKLFRRHRLSLPNRWVGTVCVLVLGMGSIMADWLNGSLESARGDRTHLISNLAYSPSLLIVRTTVSSARATQKAVFNPLETTRTASGRYFAPLLEANTGSHDIERLSDPKIAALLPDKVVLIVVESLSVLRADTNLARWLAPLRPLEPRYQIETGTLEWFGSTLRGEIRELCWRNLEGWNLGDIPPSLPSVLKEAGFETALFHGFFSTMYNRNKHYPRLGFDRLTFLEQMQATNTVPLSGALFRGAEDGYVANLVHQELLKPGRRFVHWMTLSGHTPIDVRYAKRISQSAEDPSIPVSVWAHVEICENVFQLIAKIASDEAIGHCDFIIVGDHPVPMSNPTTRAWYVEQTVPYVLLRQQMKPSGAF